MEILRAYWRIVRPDHWLFPGRDRNRPLDQQVLHTACKYARLAAGLTKPVTVHTLRHSATPSPLDRLRLEVAPPV